MKKHILLYLLITLPFLTFSQISENEFLKKVEWLNENPLQSNDKLLIKKSVELIKFQVMSYPEFSINVSGTKELDKEWKNHKYEKYFVIIYSFNQLYYKLKNKKFNYLDASVFAISMIIKSYSKIIENNPEYKIEILELYKNLKPTELRKRIKRII